MNTVTFTLGFFTYKIPWSAYQEAIPFIKVGNYLYKVDGWKPDENGVMKPILNTNGIPMPEQIDPSNYVVAVW